MRKGGWNELRRAGLVRHLDDERRLDAVERFVPLADEAGLPLTHLAMAFTVAHPGVTSAIVGPRTMDHLDDLLAGLDVALDDDLLDRIDEIVPPGTDVGTLDQVFVPPALRRAALRRRPVADRRAARTRSGGGRPGDVRGRSVLVRGRRGRKDQVFERVGGEEEGHHHDWQKQREQNHRTSRWVGLWASWPGFKDGPEWRNPHAGTHGTGPGGTGDVGVPGAAQLAGRAPEALPRVIL